MNREERETFLAEIRERARKATPGPWRWYGNTDRNDFSLATSGWGGQFVMRFRRFGMQAAQPVFSVGRTWTENPQSEWDFSLSGNLTPARDLAIYEVAPDATSRKDKRVYRADITGIRHPDAEFIAHSRADVEQLLAIVDDLKHELHIARLVDAMQGGDDE